MEDKRKEKYKGKATNNLIVAFSAFHETCRLQNLEFESLYLSSLLKNKKQKKTQQPSQANRNTFRMEQGKILMLFLQSHL